MKAYALLGGPKSEWPQDIKEQFKSAKSRGDLIVGVDRGSLLLMQMGIVPDLALGDFDSLQKSELAIIEKKVADVRYSNPVKDDTDSELMLRVTLKDYCADQLMIYGATGGRIDHFLVNLLMLLNPEFHQYVNKIQIIDQQNQIAFYLPGHYQVRKQAYYYFGVAALMGVEKLNIVHAKYLLKDFSSPYPRVFSSNEYLPNSTYFNLSFKKGLVAVIFSKDLDRYQGINN